MVTDRIGPVRLQLHLEVRRPVELIDLTLAFSSFARQYRKYLLRSMKQNRKDVSDDDVKLYVTEIRSGSVVAEMAGATEMFGALFSVLDYAKLFVDYAKFWKETIDYFRGHGEPAAEYTKSDCDDVENLCRLVAENEDGRLNLSTIEYQRTEGDEPVRHLRMSFGQQECIEAQIGALREKQRLEAAGSADYPAVIMRWYQTNVGKAKSEGRTGDRAIIDDIMPGKDLPVYFASEIDHQKVGMLDEPYRRSFVVDVNVRKVRGEPKAYTIMRVRDILEPDILLPGQADE